MLAVGSHVLISGLQGKPELNGKRGVCVALQLGTERWTVRFCDGSGEFALKAANLNAVKPKLRVAIGSAAMQGVRPSQEDRHVKIPDFSKAARALKLPVHHLEMPCALCCVFDGHCGQACSEFAAKGMHMKILRRLSSDDCSFRDDISVEAALRGANADLDAEFLARYRTATDGTTSLVALITGERCFVSWAGDSRCILGRRHADSQMLEAFQITADHRPSNDTEAARILQVGGEVVNVGDGAMRVARGGYEERVREIVRAEQQGLGCVAKEPVAMAVSRSLGDRDFKAVTCGQNVISAKPEVVFLRLSNADRFIVLVSDGITDAMTNDEIVSLIAAALDTNSVAGDSPDGAAHAACLSLVKEALVRGSQDNVTAVLVELHWECTPPSTRQMDDSWQVKSFGSPHDSLNVRQRRCYDAPILGTKKIGDIFQARDEGDWVRLLHEDGYVRKIDDDDDPLLERLDIDSAVQILSSTRSVTDNGNGAAVKKSRLH